MKYFLVDMERNYNSPPDIIDWHQKINVRDITPERAGNIQDWTQVRIDNGDTAIFLDILDAPGFLLSPMVYDVIKFYNPYIQYKHIILQDSSAEVIKQYLLPILPTCDCLLPESEIGRGKDEIIYGVIDLEKTRRRPIIKIGGMSNIQIAFRLDLVESILRRGAKGFSLKELEVR